MDTDEQPEVHVSIQKGFSFPALQKCINCCTPGKFHCPFCQPTFFKPSKYSRTMLHLENHLKRAVYMGEYTIHKCALGCRKEAHYHCMYCTAMLIRKNRYTAHLSMCCKVKHGRGQNLSNLQESDGDNVVIMDSDDEQGEEASSSSSSSSSSQSVTPIAMRSAERGSSKCDQTVQTNFEKPQDCDEYYFMSLVKLFKKLAPQKKADVRMKIERLLFEAEFE